MKSFFEKRKWSESEDEILINAYQKYPRKWGKIAIFLKYRTPTQCAQHYRRKFKLSPKKKIWTPSEDKKLLQMIKIHGNHWQKIALLGSFSRNGKQLRERFLNVLDPKIVNEKWKEYEDEIIIAKVKEIGKKWSQIAKFLKGRSENNIKNRFYCHLWKKINNESICTDSTVDDNKIIRIKSNNNLVGDYDRKSDCLSLKIKLSSEVGKENFEQTFCSFLPEDLNFIC